MVPEHRDRIAVRELRDGVAGTLAPGVLEQFLEIGVVIGRGRLRPGR